MKAQYPWWKDRWFLLGLAVLVMNGAALLYWLRSSSAPPPADSGTPVQAVDADPSDAPTTVTLNEVYSGPNSELNNRDPLVMRFTQAVVPEAWVGKVVQTSPVHITPNVPGRYRWTKRSELRFTPDDPWPLCRKFTLSYRGLQDTPTNLRMLPWPDFQFHSSFFAVKEIQQIDYESGRHAVLRIAFNKAPDMTLLDRMLYLRDTQGRRVEWTLRSAGEDGAVVIRTGRIASENFTLGIRDGLMPAEGDLGMRSAFQRGMDFVARFEYTGIKAHVPAFEPGYIDLKFTSNADFGEADAFIRVHPQVAFTMAPMYVYRGGGIRLQGDFQAGITYEVELLRGLPADNGSLLESAIKRRIRMPDLPPTLSFQDQGRVLSSRGALTLPLSVINEPKIHLQVHRVHNNNIPQLALRQANRVNRYYGEDHAGLSALVAEEDIVNDGGLNQVVTVPIKLPDLIPELKPGAYLIKASGTRSWEDRMVVVTDLGLTLKRGNQEMLVWVNHIHSLEAAEEAKVQLISPTYQVLGEGKTDADGLARVVWEGDERVEMVLVSQGDDIAYLNLTRSVALEGSSTRGDHWVRDRHEAYLYTDRGVYRPGETVHLRALVRSTEDRAPGPEPLVLTITDPRGNEIHRDTLVLSKVGTLHTPFPLPGYRPTGTYQVRLTMPGLKAAVGQGQFKVEDFVPPTLDVAVEMQERDPDKTDSFGGLARARYFFGGEAVGHGYTARAEFSAEDFAPEGWENFRFVDHEKSFPLFRKRLAEGHTDEKGRGFFQVQADAKWQPPSALRAVVSVEVQETSGRRVSALASERLDCYPRYVGMRPEWTGTFVPVGTVLQADTALVYPDGRAVEGSHTLQAELCRVSWLNALRKEGDGFYRYRSERHLEIVRSWEVNVAEGRGKINVTPDVSGNYLLRLVDPQGGAGSTLSCYTGSASSHANSWSRRHPDRLEVVPDRDTYQTGETMSWLLKAPFSGRVLVTLETDRVLQHQVLNITGNTARVSFTLDEACRPNVYCVATLVRPVRAGEEPGLHRASGVSMVRLVDDPRRLITTLIAPEKSRPAQALEVRVSVADAAGLPAEAEVVVAAVDEGICRLTNFKTPVPEDFFQRKRGIGVHQFDVYSMLLPEFMEAGAGPSNPGGGGGGAALLRGLLSPVDARRFKPLALWSGPLNTDSNGMATVRFELPEFNGEVRLMAVAVDPSRSGSSETSVQVSRPLILQGSGPRFLAPGDRSQLPVRLFNRSDHAMDVELGWSLSGALSTTSGVRMVTLEPGEDAQVQLDVQATEPGVGQVRITADSGAEHGQDAFEVPVRPAASRQHLAGFHRVAPGERATLDVPAPWFKGTESYSLRLSTRRSLSLDGCLQDLLRYPHGCLEQTVSKAMPLLYLADLAHVAAPGTIGQEEVTVMVRRGIERVLSLQYGTRGFRLWPGSRHPYPWGSIYATHFLVEADQAGYDVPEGALDRALDSLDHELDRYTGRMDERELQHHMERRAYAVRVLARAGRRRLDWSQRLLEMDTQRMVATRIHLAAALAEMGDAEEAAALLQQIGMPEGADIRDINGNLGSLSRSDAMLLSAWLSVDPDHPVVMNLVERLEQRMQNGRFSTTQENAWAVLALGRYARLEVAEVGTPTRGEVKLPDGTKVDFNTEETRSVPLTSPGRIQVHNQGERSIYVQWTSTGIPADGQVEEIDKFLEIRRSMWTEDGKPMKDTTFTPGQLVVIKLDIDILGDSSIDNLVVEDLLPAGWEIENPNLDTSTGLTWVKKHTSISPEHVERRDDRILLFLGPLRKPGSYAYAVRAVTPGVYHLPPVQASCMYSPEIHSAHGAGQIEVKRP